MPGAALCCQGFWDSPHQSSGKGFFKVSDRMVSDWGSSHPNHHISFRKCLPSARMRTTSKGGLENRAAAAGDGPPATARQDAGFLLQSQRQTPLPMSPYANHGNLAVAQINSKQKGAVESQLVGQITQAVMGVASL